MSISWFLVIQNTHISRFLDILDSHDPDFLKNGWFPVNFDSLMNGPLREIDPKKNERWAETMSICAYNSEACNCNRGLTVKFFDIKIGSAIRQRRKTATLAIIKPKTTSLGVSLWNHDRLWTGETKIMIFPDNQQCLSDIKHPPLC